MYTEKAMQYNTNRFMKVRSGSAVIVFVSVIALPWALRSIEDFGTHSQSHQGQKLEILTAHLYIAERHPIPQ